MATLTDTNEKLGYKSKVAPKKHFVYKWTNVVTKEYYIGKHSGTEDDGYIGSGKLFKVKYNNDVDNWQRQILYYAPSSKAAYYAEKNFIGDLYKIDPLCLNLVPGGSNESKLKKHEADKLIAEKTQKLHKCTIYQWLGIQAFNEYVYIGNNAHGDYKMFSTIPAGLNNFITYLKNNSKKKYSYSMLNKFFVAKDMSVEMIPNYAELLENKEEYDSLVEFADNFKQLVSDYNMEIANDSKENVKQKI